MKQAGAAVENRLFGLGLEEIYGRTNSSTSQSYLTDAPGSAIQLANPDQDAQAARRGGAFGHSPDKLDPGQDLAPDTVRQSLQREDRSRSMKTHLWIAFVLAAGYAGVAAASAELAEAKQCSACHTADKEMIGPSYRAIADRYGDKPEAFDMLVRKVKSGGMGHWGEAIMAPTSARVALSDDEAAQLVKWVLGHQ